MNDESGPDAVLERWSRVVRRRWRGAAAIGAGVVLLGAALLFLTRPVWRAEAALRLGAPPPVGGVSLGSNGSPSGLLTLFQQMTGDPFANELELLDSRTVTEGVVRDAALNVTLRTPRGWYRDSLFTRLSAGDDTRKATFRAEWLGGGRVAVRRTSPSDSMIGTFAPATPAAFGGIVAVFRPYRAGQPRTVDLHTLPFGDAVRRTARRLQAERTRREANLVRVHYDDPDPGLALAVVRSAADRYIALRSALQRRESGQTRDSLETVVGDTRRELRREEDALERFQHGARVIAPQAQAEAVIKRQAEVATELQKARGELAGTDEVLRRLAAEPDPATAWAGLVAHPTFLENRTLGDLLGTLVHAQQQRIDLASHRTAEDPQARALDRQIRYVDASLRSMVRQYRDGVAREVDRLQAQWAALDSVIAAAPAAEVRLGRYQRDVRLLSEVYLFADQRLRQEALRDAVSFASVQLVDPPELLFKPVWPRKGIGLAVTLLLALVFGTLAVAAAERADRRIRGAAELRRLARVPVLSALATDADGRPVLPAPDRQALLAARPRLEVPGPLVLAPVDDPSAAEALAAALRDPAPEGAGATRPGVAALAHAGAAGANAAGDDRAHGQPGAGRGRGGNGGGGNGAAGNGAGGNRAGNGDGRRHGGAPGGYTGIVATRPLDGYGPAAEAAAECGRVILVVREGVTRRDDLARAAAFLGEACADVAGIVVLAASAREAEAVWRS